MIGAMSTLSDTLRQKMPHKKVLPPIILMTDDDRLADPADLLKHLPRGSAVVVRSSDQKTLADRAFSLRKATQSLGLKLLIANDWRLAHSVKADGIHLSESTWRHQAPYWRRSRKPDWLITAACHSHLNPDLVDAVLVSPIFSTPSHPMGQTLGVLRFQSIAQHCPKPIYAMGGVTLQSRIRLHGQPLAGIAGITLFP